MLRQQTTKLEQKVESTKDEIGKGNQIIAKLQQQGQEVRQKYKQKQQLIQTMEVKINEKTQKIDDLMRESVSNLKETELLKVEITDLKSINGTLKSKLVEAQESLKSNENLITYLNKQLNEKPGGSSNPLSKPPAGVFKPSLTNLD